MKINSVYEAIGGVDERFVSEAAAVRKKRPILLIIAAAAAALTLIVGAASVNSDHSTFSIGKDVAFNIHLRKYNITVPEEYMPTEEYKYQYTGKVDMGVAELFEKFNAPLLITDKFSAEIDPDAEGVVPWTYKNWNTGEEYEVNDEPFIDISFVDRGDVTVDFTYYLYSKTLDRNIGFFAYYLTDKASGSEGIQDGIDSRIPVEVITLRDGSKCAVAPGYACFSYNGVYYRFGLGEGEFTQEMTMQVLEDLEVL